VEIEVEEMPQYVGQSLAQLGAAYSDSAVKKVFNEYGLDWFGVSGWGFNAVRAYVKLTISGMDAVARGGKEIRAIMEYTFRPSKPSNEKAESEWVYTKAGLFRKEVSGIRWKGGALADKLNAEPTLQQRLLSMKQFLDKVYVVEGEVRFRFNTLVVGKGMLSTKRLLYCLLPTKEFFEAADTNANYFDGSSLISGLTK
jgi:hypothetical protein